MNNITWNSISDEFRALIKERLGIPMSNEIASTKNGNCDLDFAIGYNVFYRENLMGKRDVYIPLALMLFPEIWPPEIWEPADPVPPTEENTSLQSVWESQGVGAAPTEVTKESVEGKFEEASTKMSRKLKELKPKRETTFTTNAEFFFNLEMYTEALEELKNDIQCSHKATLLLKYKPVPKSVEYSLWYDGVENYLKQLFD